MQHEATVKWRLEGDMPSGRYSRAHTVSFDGGVTVAGSPSTDIVPEPYADASAVDPEEMFVAALSSCHMLWFLDLSRRAGWVANSYRDHAVGVMTKNEAGAQWISRATLSPEIDWADPAPDAAEVDRLHDEAHHACFIANSTKTEIVIA